tara:strand:+ start:539 stop:727 length:189 start_codon:yes stop_codon:yes gene_type:complete
LGQIFKGAIVIETIETLKTSGVGIGGWWLSISGWLTDVVSLGVGIATLVYLIIKIRKELRTR